MLVGCCMPTSTVSVNFRNCRHATKYRQLSFESKMLQLSYGDFFSYHAFPSDHKGNVKFTIKKRSELPHTVENSQRCPSPMLSHLRMLY